MMEGKAFRESLGDELRLVESTLPVPRPRKRDGDHHVIFERQCHALRIFDEQCGEWRSCTFYASEFQGMYEVFDRGRVILRRGAQSIWKIFVAYFLYRCKSGLPAEALAKAGNSCPAASAKKIPVETYALCAYVAKQDPIGDAFTAIKADRGEKKSEEFTESHEFYIAHIPKGILKKLLASSF